MFDLPRHKGKDEKHVNHDFHYNVGHFWCRWDIDIYPQSCEEILDTFKKVDKCVLVGTNGKNSLKVLGVKEDIKIIEAERTERREAMPVKITPAGGYAWKIDVSVQVSNETY